MPDLLEVEFAAEISEVARVLDAVEAFGESQHVPARAIHKLNVVLDELITNIAQHGLSEGGHTEVRLSIALNGGVLDVHLSDNGKAFDPTAAPMPELATSLEQSRVGGLGVRLVRSFVDRLDYSRDGGFNQLHLQIDPARAEGAPHQ